MTTESARLTVADAARWLHVSYGCVDQWIRRGLAHPVGVNDDGRALYDLAELARVERRTRRERRGRPRLTRSRL